MADNVDNKPPVVKKFKPKRKHRLVWIAVLISVLIVGLGAYGVYSYFQGQTGTYQQKNTKADDLASKGKFGDALTELKSAEGSATTDQEKIDLYTKQALAAVSDGKFNEALSYLDKKHQLAPNTTNADARMTGGIYERLGDNDKAKEFYNKALDYLQSLPQSDEIDRDIDSLKAYIASMDEPPAPEAPKREPK